MSVTFMLPSEFRVVTRDDVERARALKCPICEGHDIYGQGENKIVPQPDCDHCGGGGGNFDALNAVYERQAIEDGEFNVANANAIYIVQDLLNLPHTEVYGGSVEAHEVLTRLAVVFNIEAGVVAPSEGQAVRLSEEGVSLGCRVINGGRSLSQCERYVESLRRLAEIALERGAPEIYWG